MEDTKKDNRDKVKDLIKSITGEEAKIVAVPSELIHFIGDAGKAVLLSQLIYWSDKGGRKDGLIFKTYDEIYAETGIKEKTCSRYYKEFKEKGFFDWKIKKANSFPTVHFKLDMVKLTRLIETFWVNRNSQNDQNDTVIMSESLTENTNKDISLSKNRETLIHAKNAKEEEQKEVNDSTVTSNSDGFYNSSEPGDWNSVPVPVDYAVPLPINFQPSLENQHWAVTSFPCKSPELATNSFIGHPSNKNKTNTLEGWQNDWRRWMQKEDELKGYDENKLIAEHNKIKNKVLNVVCKLASETSRFLLQRDSFYSILCREEHSFSRETIDDCLTFLKSNDYLATFFGDYFYVSKINKEGEWEDVTDLSDIYGAWNSVDQSLEQYITDNCLVHHSQILDTFAPKYKDSVELYLTIGVEYGYLKELNGHYLSADKYEDDENYRNAANAKGKELGFIIKCTEESHDTNEESHDIDEDFMKLLEEGYSPYQEGLYAGVN
jgi:nucleoside diphosphate kinase